MNTRKGFQGSDRGDGDRWNAGKRLNDPFFFAGAMGIFMPGAAPSAGFMAATSGKRRNSRG